jgi:hypothetical protein
VFCSSSIVNRQSSIQNRQCSFVPLCSAEQIPTASPLACPDLPFLAIVFPRYGYLRARRVFEPHLNGANSNDARLPLPDNKSTLGIGDVLDGMCFAPLPYVHRILPITCKTFDCMGPYRELLRSDVEISVLARAGLILPIDILLQVGVARE